MMVPRTLMISFMPTTPNDKQGHTDLIVAKQADEFPRSYCEGGAGEMGEISLGGGRRPTAKASTPTAVPLYT